MRHYHICEFEICRFAERPREKQQRVGQLYQRIFVQVFDLRVQQRHTFWDCYKELKLKLINVFEVFEEDKFGL